jgi:hypothetical protein
VTFPRRAGLFAARAAVGRLLGFALDGFAFWAFARDGFADAVAEGREGLLALDGLAAAAERATEVLRFTAMDDS